MPSEAQTAESIIRAKLADGRTICDEDVRALLAQMDEMRMVLLKYVKLPHRARDFYEGHNVH